MLTCDLCDAPYGADGWVDCVIPNTAWNSLGFKLLCFRCMTKELEKRRLRNVPILVASGPYSHDPEAWRIEGVEHGMRLYLDELTTARATIAQQQKRIEAGERVTYHAAHLVGAAERMRNAANALWHAHNPDEPIGDVKALSVDDAQEIHASAFASLRSAEYYAQRALDAFRKSALTKAFKELSSTVDAIRTKEMEQSAIQRAADECGNDPPIGVEP